ncbi:MAG: acyl-CoA dehydrogenase family protein [Bacteroidetes bacterium]|nr:acyl-CoA dehydrogenase family protein [Bacteroidota bacterium]
MGNSSIKGGDFLIREVSAGEVFTPEQFSDEHNMIAELVNGFVEQEVMPHLDDIDAMKEGLLAGIMKKAGEQGLFQVSVPEAYGGMEVDKTTSIIIADYSGKGASFAVSLGAHTGIGTLPILYFGTEEQKKKYIPKLASGEYLGAYALTEAGSGSDALGAKAKAEKSADGKSWILNGEKMWITNAGFADVFVVFAKVDGEQFTGFIVERTDSGVSLGAEEKKMGIKGSSTRVVKLDNCVIPADRVLGEIGKGHKIAFNILNVGRFKLGASTIGASKYVMTEAVKYANERKQFGVTIGTFGAIQHKIAEMAIRNYAGDSMLYRTAGHLDAATHGHQATTPEGAEAVLRGIEEFAVECSILKVAGSEILDYVADEGVQILGGYGFSAEYPMDRPYRDSRINRIFEGTNEINRLLIPGMLLKRAMKGQLNLMGPAMAVQGELMSVGGLEEESGELFAAEKKAIANAKKVFLMVAGFGVQKYMDKIADEQEIMMNVADIIMDIYAMESMLLRTEKRIAAEGREACAHLVDAVSVYVNDAMDRIASWGKTAIASMSEGDDMKMLLSGLKRFTRWTPVNTRDARRRIARRQLESNRYDM